MFTRLARHLSLAATLAIGALCAAAVALPQAAQAAPKAPAVITYTNLTLLHGWHSDTIDGSAKAAVADISGIVTFRGAMWAPPGSSDEPFVLPKAFRPANLVYIPVDLCSANKGRLDIYPNGAVLIESEGTFTNATCFTLLDGASFAKSGTGFTSLTLLNGWHGYGGGTANAAARLISGIVHFRGAISSGSNSRVLTLPKALRPAKLAYIPVDLCNANNGRLEVWPTGAVYVDAEIRFSDATCFTSLEGASFALSGTGFTTLALKNGWHSYGSGTASAGARLISGVVHFRGAIKTSGTNPFLFTLPKALRPAHKVWTPVDLCNANNGRLYIQPSGVVQVQEEGGTFKHASCFTSLDGAWFAR